MSTIRMRITLQDDVANVRSVISHPMEIGTTGSYWETGHYIHKFTVEHNGETVMVAHWGTGVSRNPYTEFDIVGASRGDTIKLSWEDNKGGSDSLEGTV